MRAPRVHHAARRRGGSVAACGACAAARADAAHRRARALRRRRSGRTGPPRGVPAGAAAIGLDRRRATCGSTPAGAPGDAERIRKYAAELLALTPDVILANGGPDVSALRQTTVRCRSCSRTLPIRSAPASSRACRGRGATVTGFIPLEVWHERKMAGAAQGDCAQRDARGGPSRSRHLLPGSAQLGAIQAVAPSFGRGGKPDRACATPARSSAPSPISRARRTEA